MTPIPTELRELLERVLDSLDCESIRSTGFKSKLCEDARALLATPPADAADMGGQAGEEVEVVAYIGRESRMTTEGWEDGHEYVVLAEHASEADKRYDVPLMTVAQHRRILAQHRQQAGKLAEALREIADDTWDNKSKAQAEEALADWENKQ